MSNKTWSLYEKDTGVFTGAIFSGPDLYLQQQLGRFPALAAWEGRIDRTSVRVDVAAGALVPLESTGDEPVSNSP